jgi:hypothetical protein
MNINMNFFVLFLTLSIFSYRRFGLHIRKGSIDYKEVAKKVLEKFVLFLCAWFLFHYFSPAFAQQFLIVFCTAAVGYFVVYACKYFIGSEL